MGFGFGWEIMDAFSGIMMVIFPFLFFGILFFNIASMVSPKFRGKMMSRDIRAKKYMMEESRDDMKDIADMSADAGKEAITTVVRAVKDGISEDKIFCKYCGGEIDSDSIFCKHCGKDLR
ncbi:MAG: hypothetical protein IKM61_02260 [Eubacteriaceae bacterium]|nr:hypothetical protein [Eubacteriaceae bacterium]